MYYYQCVVCLWHRVVANIITALIARVIPSIHVKLIFQLPMCSNAVMMLPCPLHTLIGYDCPFCGMQRSVVALCSGRLYEAFMLNPVVWCLMPYFGVVVMCSFSCKVQQSRVGVWAMKNSTICVVGAILLAWGIVRNVITK